MSPTTVYLAKIIGLSFLISCSPMAVRPRAALEAVNGAAASPGLILIVGVFTVIAGVALTVGHNLWSGGPVVIAVTMIGWITLLKGGFLVGAPASLMSRVYKGAQGPNRFRLIMGLGAIFGAWMTTAAFLA